ncbi:MAG: hypothetical protein R3A51_17075 [Nannocystaceae bacterium]
MKGADAWIEQVTRDYTEARLEPVDRAILDYAVKLTVQPGEMVEGDVAALRACGLSDAAIHHVAQVAALFNYYNRLVDGLGADDEPDW